MKTLNRSFLLGFSWLILFTGCESFTNAMHDEPIEVDPHKRSFGQSIEDDELERIIRVNIKKTSESIRDTGHVNVNVYNNVVLLTGDVASEIDKKHAYSVADKIYQVRQIHNELNIGDQESFKTKITDSYIKGAIKAEIKKDELLDHDHFRIIVEDKTVYLMGMVTENQGSRATNIARTTVGVNKVVKVFEYINP